MSRLLQPSCFNQVQSRVWGRLWGFRAESSGSPANIGSIIFQLNPLMRPSARCVCDYIWNKLKNLGPSVPADQLVFLFNPWSVGEQPTAASTHTPAAPQVVGEAHFRCTKSFAGSLRGHLRVSPSLVIAPLLCAGRAGAGRKKRETLLGEPQSVNHSRTRRHQMKPITLEIRSVGS